MRLTEHKEEKRSSMKTRCKSPKILCMFICGELASQIHAIRGTCKHPVYWDKLFVLWTNHFSLPPTQPATTRMCRIRPHVSSPSNLCFTAVLVNCMFTLHQNIHFCFPTNHTKYNKTPILHSQNLCFSWFYAFCMVPAKCP